MRRRTELNLALRTVFLVVLAAILTLRALGPVAPSRADGDVTARAPVDAARLSILPWPRSVRRLPGALSLPSPVVIRSDAPDAHRAALSLAADLRHQGASVSVDPPGDAPTTIAFALHPHVRKIGNEGYRLDVDDSGATIAANSGAGLYYGALTFAQLVTTAPRGARVVPAVQIVDWPEFAWRGLHLDVSRHFFPVPVVEQYIDTAARFKLNTFHWHLTDDQSWRIEIPGYPLLVSVGGCRDGTALKPCAHYSARDVREVVAYATARHVQIVPEIEGPGHSAGALRAYDYLACAGSADDAMCPTPKTFAFYDGVFRELAKLFPGPFVHVGGDEVDYIAWRKSSDVQALMRRAHLTDYAQVQGYFTRRIERIANRHGRRIVGWDEIDKVGASKTAVVMAWTGAGAGATAIAHGHEVVMSPGPPLYFDAYQGPPEGEPRAIGGFTTLRAVYAYDPLEGIPLGARHRVLGAQGNVWAEYIATPEHLWYMAYPRALALAELTWTPRSRMHWPSFEQRAGLALQHLESAGITFRIPEVGYRLNSPAATPFEVRPNVYRVVLPACTANATVVLEPFVPNAAVRYTLDGSVPTVSSPLYAHPLQLRLRGGVRIGAIASLKGYRASAPSFLTLVVR